MPMRTVLAVSLLALAPAAARAEGPTVVELEVGETKALGGTRPICDDPRVAIITADGHGILKAIGPGETTCSLSPAYNPGWRSVYRVVVRRADLPEEK